MKTKGKWHFTAEGIFDSEDQQIASLIQNEQQYFKTRAENIANAEFICKAVNNYDALVDALKTIQATIRLQETLINPHEALSSILGLAVSALSDIEGGGK